jgi:hypothetical protein
VASALGRRYGVRVSIGGEKAFSDGRDIFLPSLPLDSNQDLVRLARGYLDHEAAHIRETDFKLAKKAGLTPFELHVWNSIEDFRVEKILGNQYVGCKANFEWLILKFFDHDLEEDSAPDRLTLNWILVKLRSFSVPELEPRVMGLQSLLDDALPGLSAKLSPILGDIQSYCQSTRDSLDFAGKIRRAIDGYLKDLGLDTPAYEALKNFQFEPGTGEKAVTGEASSPSRREAERDSTDESPGQRTDGDSSGDSSERDRGCQAHEDKGPAEAKDGRLGSEENTDNNPSAGSASRLKSLLEADMENLPPSLDTWLEQSLNKVSAENDYDSIMVARAAPLALEELSRDQILESRKVTLLLSSKLQSLLQSLTVKHTLPGCHGRLDTNLVHKLSLNSPKVFRRGGARMGLDAAVHILIDTSGSMGNLTKLASVTAYSLCRSLTAVPGINVAATAFPGGLGNPASYLNGDCWATVTPLLRHGEAMHRRFQLHPSGTTPMAEALWWVLQEMNPLKESRKLVFIVTDGEPDSMSDTRTAVQEAKRAGFELFGLGLGANSVSDLLPGRSEVITDCMDLPGKLFRLLGRAMRYASYGG